jgi:nitrite reductase/ring-hydroxylating ferredoxin subunit
MSWVHGANAALPDETVVRVDDGVTTAALARVDDSWFALDVWCTHDECPLTDGWVEERALRCACHGALFDLATGEPLEGPAEEPVRTYPTRIVDGRVEVELP